MKDTTNKFFTGVLEKSKFGEEFPTGTTYAYRAWSFSLRNKSSEFECNDLPFDDDMKDFVDALRAADVDTLAITDQSTALMKNLHTLDALGCMVLELCKVTRIENEFRPDIKTEHEAIKIKL